MAKAFKAKTKIKSTKIKFGIQVPMGIRQAYEIDKQNNNNEWEEAIKKELKQLSDYGTFKMAEDGEKLNAYKKIPYHIVFDVKFDLRKKARLVAGGIGLH